MKVSTEYSVYMLRKQHKNCQGILTRTPNPSEFSEMTASANRISVRSIREWTPSLRNPRNDSCFRSNSQNHKNAPRMQHSRACKTKDKCQVKNILSASFQFSVLGPNFQNYVQECPTVLKNPGRTRSLPTSIIVSSIIVSCRFQGDTNITYLPLYH